MQTSRFNLTIDGLSVSVTSFDLPKESGQSIAGRTHHVWLLDASYSMSGVMDRLKQQAKEVGAQIRGNDLLSVLYFAGEGQCGALVTGAKVDADINALIDGLHPMGCTCFSEVTAEVAKIVGRLDGLTDQTVVTLFTDGCPVTSKPEAVEEHLTVNAVAAIAAACNLVAFNAIGYTAHYNADFLNLLVSMTAHGRFVHASNIADFHKIMNTNMETVGALRTRKIEITAPGSVLYLTSKTSSFSNLGLHLSTVDETRNTVYVIGADAFAVKDGDATLSIVESVDDDGAKLDFVYAMAARAYAEGRRQVALDLIAREARDRALADAIQSAFTVEETGGVQNRLEEAAIGVGRYINGTAPENYLPAPDAFCVMDLFATIFANPNDFLFVPFSKNTSRYERIGRVVTAHQDHFVRDDEAEVRVPVKKFIFNKERLNLSLQVPMDGTVRLNPKSLARVNEGAKKALPELYPAKIFRAYTLIQDGVLNMPDLEFLIADAAWLSLPERDSLSYNHMGYETIDGRVFHRILFMLEELPIINRLYIDRAQSIEDLHSRVVELTRWEGAALVVGAHLKATLEAGGSKLAKQDEYAGLTAAQITFLKESGVSQSGIYNAPDRSVAGVGKSDFYMARKLAFAIKGSTLPSVAEFTEMRDYREENGKKVAGKKPNWSGVHMLNYEQAMLERARRAGLDPSKPTAKLRNFFQAEELAVDKVILAHRFEINSVKLAKMLTGDWFTGLTKTPKGELVHEIPDASTLVVKTERTRVPV